MEGPLTELRNQRQPRRKMAQTYGKKKIAGISAIHRDIFGRDTATVESRLAELTLRDAQSSGPAVTSPSRVTRRFEIATDATASDVPDIPQLPQVLSKSPVGTAESPAFLRLRPDLSKLDPISMNDYIALKPLLSLSESKVDLFKNFGDRLAKSFDVEKLGEGSFAEVFRVTAKLDQPSTSSSTSTSQTMPSGGTIIKLIPLHLPSLSGLHLRGSSVSSVAREVKISQTLDSMHGFIRFRGIRIVTGEWPRSFLDAWFTFRRRHKKRAINCSPKEDFDEEQAYAILEMDNAGHEISLIKKPSIFQIYDIFWQTVILLANAEERIDFEHRDLHLSNLCVKPLPTSDSDETDSNNSSESTTKFQRELDIDRKIIKNMNDDNIPTLRLGHARLKVTMIDYTITRCRLKPSTSIAYDPMKFLSEPLHEGEDYEEIAQMKTYRKTKAAVLLAQKTSGVAKEEKWSQHVPQTNTIWLGYLLDVLSHRARGRSSNKYILRGSSAVAKHEQTLMWEVVDEVQAFVDGVDPAAEEDSGEDGVGVEVNNLGNDKEFSDEELRRIPVGARAVLAKAVEKKWLSGEEIREYLERLEMYG